MNKKLNKILNIIELIALFLVVVSLATLAFINLNEIRVTGILTTILFLLSILSEITIITIELALFIILNKKIRLFYIAYIILDLVLTIFINNLIPFSGLIVVLFSAVVKSIIRINYTESIYNKKEFRRYCKMFGIEVKSTKKKPLIIKVLNKDFETTPKKVSVIRKSIKKSYA